MSSQEIHLHIRLTRRAAAAMTLCVLVMSAVVAGPRIADAVSKKQSLCLATKGTLVKRSTCRKSETQVAAGVYVTSNLATKELGGGVTTMSATDGVSTGAVRSAETGDLSGRVLTAESLFTASLQTVTSKYSVPSGWSGSLEGACPETAPIPVSWGAYSPEWQPLLDAKKVRFQIAPLMFAMGSRAQISGYPTSDAGVGNDPAVTGRSVKDPFTLYVSQVCAQAVQLEPVTG